MLKKILVCVMIILLLVDPVRADAKTLTNKEEVYQVLKNKLIDRKAEVVIEMDKSVMNEIKSSGKLLDAIIALDDKSTSKDGDYLYASMKSWKESWTYSTRGSVATLKFTAKYRTTLTQEQKLDTKIESILTKLNLKKASDYKKVKAIHDYIINRVSYDKTLKNHTAYHAIISKSAVCEGYSAAAYRLLTDAGIECRIITGTAGGGAHSWNIVKVDGKWYNLDLTWDDPITSSGKQVLRYDYFLKNTKDFSDHIRDSKYNTKAFLKAYPIATKSYKMPSK